MWKIDEWRPQAGLGYRSTFGGCSAAASRPRVFAFKSVAGKGTFGVAVQCEELNEPAWRPLVAMPVQHGAAARAATTAAAAESDDGSDDDPSGGPGDTAASSAAAAAKATKSGSRKPSSAVAAALSRMQARAATRRYCMKICDSRYSFSAESSALALLRARLYDTGRCANVCLLYDAFTTTERAPARPCPSVVAVAATAASPHNAWAQLYSVKSYGAIAKARDGGGGNDSDSAKSATATGGADGGGGGGGGSGGTRRRPVYGCMLLEYVAGGTTLDAYIRLTPWRTVVANWHHLAFQILYGVHCMHTAAPGRCVLHRDLSFGNIMVQPLWAMQHTFEEHTGCDVMASGSLSEDDDASDSGNNDNDDDDQGAPHAGAAAAAAAAEVPVHLVCIRDVRSVQTLYYNPYAGQRHAPSGAATALLRAGGRKRARLPSTPAVSGSRVAAANCDDEAACADGDAGSRDADPDALHVKLIDMGLAAIVDDAYARNVCDRAVVTLQFRPIEMFFFTNTPVQYNARSEIWSAGCVLLNMAMCGNRSPAATAPARAGGAAADSKVYMFTDEQFALDNYGVAFLAFRRAVVYIIEQTRSVFADAAETVAAAAAGAGAGVATEVPAPAPASTASASTAAASGATDDDNDAEAWADDARFVCPQRLHGLWANSDITFDVDSAHDVSVYVWNTVALLGGVPSDRDWPGVERTLLWAVLHAVYERYAAIIAAAEASVVRQYRRALVERIGDDGARLLASMMQWDARRRPTTHELLCDPAFRRLATDAVGGSAPTAPPRKFQRAAVASADGWHRQQHERRSTFGRMVWGSMYVDTIAEPRCAAVATPPRGASSPALRQGADHCTPASANYEEGGETPPLGTDIVGCGESTAEQAEAAAAAAAKPNRELPATGIFPALLGAAVPSSDAVADDFADDTRIEIRWCTACSRLAYYAVGAACADCTCGNSHE